jgi:hypothetical protein
MSIRRSVIVKCVDNCSTMSVDKFDDEDVYYVTFYRSYSLKSLWYRIKDAVKVLRGIDLCTHEVILEPEDFDKIVNFKDETVDKKH